MKKGCFQGHHATDKKCTIANKFTTVNECQKTEEAKRLFPYAVKVLIFTLLLWTWEHFNKSATYGTSLGNKGVGEKESSVKGARCLKETDSLFWDYYACAGKRGTLYFPPNGTDNVKKSDYSFSRLSEGKTKDYYEMTESASGHSNVSSLSSLSEFLYNDNYEDPLTYNGVKLSNYKHKKRNRGLVSKSTRCILNFLSEMDKRIERQFENAMKYEIECARTRRGRMSTMANVKRFLRKIKVLSPAIIGTALSLICAMSSALLGCITFAIVTAFILFYFMIKIAKIHSIHEAYQTNHK
ncbi:Plasmodium exported protein, unknown function [Plasmodium vivax]|uniref:Pv-fam-d protein n=1 Tax=Plasmodium vivax TaxID=5855 RepID=A0A564ZRY6_PLAVI|nr:Plasmodium exported protein, unknown function [Plasmodium vivax]